VSISLPGLARFGCDLSATVGWIPNFGQTSQSRIRPLRHRREARAGRHAPLIASVPGQGDGLALRPARAAFINQSGSLGRIHGLDPYLRRLPIGHSPAPGMRRAATQIPAQENHPRMGMAAAISNASSVWRFGNGWEAGDYRIRGTDQSLLATSDSATNYFLGALGRRCRKRTPGPPPFSSMNSTPAASKARRTAKSFAAVSEVWSSVTSARRMVFRPKAASRARSSAVHLSRARAARI
jgi:hypothetical protein